MTKTNQSPRSADPKADPTADALAVPPAVSRPVSRAIPPAVNARLPRRTLLRGSLAGTTLGLGLPWLEAMAAPAAGKPASRSFPTRFVVFFTANGVIHKNWRPTVGPGGEGDFRFAHATPTSQDLHSLAPLEKWKRRLLVLDGIAALSRKLGPGGNGHDKGMGHLLTATTLRVGPSGVGQFAHLPDGSAGGLSIDQEVARRLEGKTRLRSLELGVQSRLDTKRQLTSRMVYRGPFQVVPPENDPGEIFRNVFTGLDRSTAGALARLRRARKSVLDQVLGDFRKLNASLPAGDRAKLDSHLTGLREVEQTLAPPPNRTKGCALPTAPEEGPDVSIWAEDRYQTVGRTQMDLLTTALACDLTRVATLQWSTAQSGVTFTTFGHTQSHHSLSHMADDTEEARRQLTQIEHFYAEQFAYLLTRLDAVPEGDGTLLDHSVVLWINEQGNGDKHSYTEIPVVIAGSGQGRLRTGRYLRFPNEPAHNDLFVSCLHALGHDDARSFGLPELSKGPLPGLA